MKNFLFKIKKRKEKRAINHHNKEHKIKEKKNQTAISCCQYRTYFQNEEKENQTA
jgi:hypothetical protein